MKIKYNLLHKDKNTRARLGTLETNYGVYDTPMFMPVGTQATVKTLSPEELKEVNSAVILANTYHLWLRPGEDIVSEASGLHPGGDPLSARSGEEFQGPQAGRYTAPLSRGQEHRPAV